MHFKANVMKKCLQTAKYIKRACQRNYSVFTLPQTEGTSHEQYCDIHTAALEEKKKSLWNLKSCRLKAAYPAVFFFCFFCSIAHLNVLINYCRPGSTASITAQRQKRPPTAFCNIWTGVHQAEDNDTIFRKRNKKKNPKHFGTAKHSLLADIEKYF